MEMDSGQCDIDRKRCTQRKIASIIRLLYELMDLKFDNSQILRIVYSIRTVLAAPDRLAGHGACRIAKRIGVRKKERARGKEQLPSSFHSNTKPLAFCHR